MNDHEAACHLVKELSQRVNLLWSADKAEKHMLISRLGGSVEGLPTGAHNYLQRVDELRQIEARAERLAGLLKEIRWDLGDVDGLPQDEYNCLLRRIDAELG